MKRNGFLALLLALAVVSGYLLSKASLVGKAGISIFYKEYSFLKTWWQGALVVLAVWLLLFLIQGKVQQMRKTSTARTTHIVAILLAIVGLYFTYNDFRHSFNHRLLGERFHLGAYLFWIGWMLISLYYLTQRKKANTPVATP